MFKKYILKSINLAGLMALASAPAFAQFPSPPPLPPLPGLEIRIGDSAPPRMRHETRPRSPGRDYTWARGSWDLQGGQWVWIDGRWDRPEHRGSRWVAARYVRDGGSYRYEPGHWSHQRMIEGDDYRNWRDKHHRRHRRDRDHDNRDRDDHDRDRERSH